MKKTKTKAKTTKAMNTKTSKSAKIPVPALYAASRASSEPRGTLRGEFGWAMQDHADAASRLRTFLKQYEPANGEYQDGFHRSRVRAAQRELMRLEYLGGDVKAGDRLLARLHDAGE